MTSDPALPEAARLEAEIDEALARGVLYHALTLGLRPPTPLGGRGDRAWPGPVREAAALLDARTPDEAVLPAVEALSDRAAEADRLPTHTRLFGHSRGLACPFETEYGPGGTFHQPQALADIAGTYLAFGLEPSQGGDERVDHAACECEFMSFLARKEAFVLGTLRTSGGRAEDPRDPEIVRRAARGFLQDHLGRFGRAFASHLIREDEDGFYGALGAVLFRLLTQDCRRFGLPPGPPALQIRPPVADDTPLACGRADEDLIQLQRRPRP